MAIIKTGAIVVVSAYRYSIAMRIQANSKAACIVGRFSVHIGPKLYPRAAIPMKYTCVARIIARSIVSRSSTHNGIAIGTQVNCITKVVAARLAINAAPF